MFFVGRQVVLRPIGGRRGVAEPSVSGKWIPSAFDLEQGCQMAYFPTKDPNLGKFWRALEWKMLVYFIVIWNILLPFGIFYRHLVLLW
jgi:hypothetical protein